MDLNNSKNNVKKPLLWLAAIFLIAMGLRLPGVFIELEPFNYCDEDLYIGPALQLAQGKITQVPHFRSGGLNFIIPSLTAQATELVTAVNTNTLRVASRIVANVVLNSLAVFLIYFSLMLLCQSTLWSLLGAAFYAISPFATAQSTWFYPDNYISVFSAATLYLTLKYVTQKPNVNSRWYWILLAGIGISIGATLSIKYSGVILFGYVGLAFIIAKPNFWDWKKLASTAKKVVFESLLVGVAAVIVFLLLNLDLFDKFDAFVADASVKHYKIVDDPFHGWAFYGSICLFFLIGIFPIFAFLGHILYREKAREGFFQSILLLVIPCIIVFGLGRYNLLFARNLQIAIPFLVVFTAVGMLFLYQLLSKMKYSLQIKSAVLVLCFLTILPRVVSQFLLDIQPDSRIQAANWITKNGYTAQQVYSNDGCSQAPINGMASRNPQYIFLDNWFGGVHRNGVVRKQGEETFSNIFGSAHLRDLHYLNHLIFGWRLGFDRNDIHKKYKPIKFFSGAGPGVVVYEKRKL